VDLCFLGSCRDVVILIGFVKTPMGLLAALVIWDKRVVEKVEEAMGFHLVSCKFREVSSGYKWAFLSGIWP
jgi:hypothetical protein